MTKQKAFMKQEIELGLNRLEYDDPGRPFRAVLVLETDKHYNGGVESNATVFWVGSHSRQHAFGLAGGGDFRKSIQRDKTLRATQKAIERQHATAFTPEAIEELTRAAIAHYGAA
jgi:hypothetical protein